MSGIDLSLGPVWADAWSVYKLLFRRSVVTAALVFAALDSLDLVVGVLVSTLLAFAGAMLVQGALVEIVRDVHEGRRPKSMLTLLRIASRRIVSLLGAALIYTLGVIIGLLLLIVPGLLIASRWSLIVPLVMLDGERASAARDRSRALVKPHTWPVLGVVVATWIVTNLVGQAPVTIATEGDASTLVAYLIDIAASALVAPFAAHVLTVLYYRITDPEHPVIHPDVRTWRSVWAGA